MKKAIVYFVKLPKLGFNKTRLQNFLSKEDIHHLSVYLLQRNFQAIKNLDIPIYVYVSPAAEKEEILEHISVDSYRIKGQLDTDHLGQKMYHAMNEVMQEGYDHVALMGCDLIDIDAELLVEVFDLLNANDVVISPTEDGGYGIIACSRLKKEIFQLDYFSHDKVYEYTLNRIEKAGMTHARTKTIHDIDYRDDLVRALCGDNSATFFNQGEYNANFLIDKGSKLLRIALGSQMHLDNQIEYEYLALKGLGHTGVVPKVYDCQPTTKMIGKGYLIEEYLPGRPLDYSTDLCKAAELLAKVHSARLDDLQHLIKADMPFRMMREEFDEMFSHYQDWKLKDPQVESKITSLLNSLEVYSLDHPVQGPCIINTELNSHNFIINDDGPSYVIDWEKPIIGEKEQDLAHFLAPTTTLWRTEIDLNRSAIDQFIEHYNEYASQSVDRMKLKQYLHFTCLRGITWCAMAYVQYSEDQKIKANDEAFHKISQFVSLPFLDFVEAYIQSLEAWN